MRVVPIGGGHVLARKNGIEVVGASEVVMYMAAGTDFAPNAKSRTTGVSIDDLGKEMMARVDAACKKGFLNIQKDHVANFLSYTGRVSLDLNAKSNRARLLRIAVL